MQIIKLKSILVLSFLILSCTSKSGSNRLTKQKKAIKEQFIDDKNKPFFNIENAALKHTSTTNQIINHTYFSLSYSEKDEQPEWVAYKVTRNNYINKIKRTNNYREDPYVKTKSATLEDYKGSGYDRGHLAPANAMKHNLNAMDESFYLSNMSPQNPSFNRGIWKVIEGKVAYWSNFNDSIYVVTGPILTDPIGKIGINKVSVPKAFYKTLLGFRNGKVTGIAFILPNEKSKKSIYSYVTSIDHVEEVTKLNFYYNLDKITQDLAEANTDIKKWVSIKN